MSVTEVCNEAPVPPENENSLPTSPRVEVNDKMAIVGTATRPTSLPVEEYRDMSDDSLLEDEDSDHDDDPLLQANPELLVRQSKLLALPEVPTFLFFMAISTQLPLQQFWLFDYFSKQYGFENTNGTDYCTNSSLSNTSDVENKVQSLTNQYVMYTGFVSSFAGIFPTLFLGPLMDRSGRKFVFYLSLAALLAAELLILMIFKFNLSPNLLFVSSSIFGLSGSFGLFLAAIFGMVADITSAGKKRTFRVATVEATISIAFSIGGSASGLWVEKLGYVWPMVFAASLIFLALLFILFLTPETYVNNHWQPFSCKSLLKSFEFYVKDAANGRRFKLTLCLICFMIFTAVGNGESNFSMLYLLHQPFCWPKMGITVFQGALILVKWIVVMLFIRLGKRCISEPVFALIGTLSLSSFYLLKGLATSNVLIFVSAGTSLMTELVSPMCRTMMSKEVSQDEQGALFAGIGVIQMIVSAVSGIVMSNIYNVGLGFYLGLPYLVLTGLTLINVVLFIVLIAYKKRHPEQTQLYLEDETMIN